jgi:hypothetical protein
VTEKRRVLPIPPITTVAGFFTGFVFRTESHTQSGHKSGGRGFLFSSPWSNWMTIIREPIATPRAGEFRDCSSTGEQHPYKVPVTGSTPVSPIVGGWALDSDFISVTDNVGAFNLTLQLQGP